MQTLDYLFTFNRDESAGVLHIKLDGFGHFFLNYYCVDRSVHYATLIAINYW